MPNMKNVISTYVSIGLGVAVVSAAVLIKDGKDSPSSIAYYTAANGLFWPAMFYFGPKKIKELEAASTEISI